MTASSNSMDAQLICQLFDGLYLTRYHTCLRGGGDEPLYTPSMNGRMAIITFRSDYVASALHEVAHWCLAGAGRRAEKDYGYWYHGERDACAQRAFEKVEARPQALEWIFSLALGIGFVPSRDNFDVPASRSFDRRIRCEVNAFIDAGLPDRAALFATSLAEGRDYLHQAKVAVSNPTEEDR